MVFPLFAAGRRLTPKALRHFIGLVLCFGLGVASAHTDQATSGSFVAGYLHPLTGVDHVLAMVAVGILGTVLGRPRLWALPIAFLLSMTIGAVVGIAGVQPPYVEQGIAISVIVLGLAILVGRQVSVGPALAVVSVFGLLHGLAHGIELPGSASPEAYTAGFLVAAGILHLAGIGVGTLGTLTGGLRWVRIGGGLIAATGVWILVGILGVI